MVSRHYDWEPLTLGHHVANLMVMMASGIVVVEIK